MTLRLARCAIIAGIMVMTTSAKAASITGSATYRERMALPPDAVFEATVEDVSRADTPATVIGRISVMPAGQVPIRFELPYAESLVQPNHRYSVRARITHGGRVLYTTTQSYPVLTPEAGTSVETMSLQRVTQLAKPDRQLTNTYWKLTELNGAAVQVPPKQREPHMILQPERNRFAGSGGCNRMMGSYRLDGPSVSFGKVASTMMACPEGMEQEAAFFRTLEAVRTWKVHGDDLELLDETGGMIARFVSVDLK